MIFHFLQSSIRGGIEEVFLEYSEALRSKDYALRAIVPSTYCYFNELEMLKVPFDILNVRGHYDIIAVLRLHVLVRRYNPRLFIVHNGRGYGLLRLYKKLFNSPIFTLAVCHGGKKRIASFDQIIVVANHLVSEFKIKKSSKKIHCVPNFIKVTRPYVPWKKCSLGMTYFGILGRLSPEKNVLLAVRAVEYMNNVMGFPCKLIVAGAGPLEIEIESYIRNHQLGSSVTMLGWVHDKELFFKEIDVLIVPSFQESFGLCILHAFHHSKPVIASRGIVSSGPEEIIEDEKNGLLFNNDSIDDLCGKMERCMDDGNHDFIRRLVFNAYDFLVREHDFKACSEKFIEIISKIYKLGS